jgi:hypothetical protein
VWAAGNVVDPRAQAITAAGAASAAAIALNADLVEHEVRKAVRDLDHGLPSRSSTHTHSNSRLRPTVAMPMMLTTTPRAGNMSDPEPAGADHQSHRTDAEAHPERAVDELEEQVLGRRMDQVRDDDTETAYDQNRDDQTPGTEQP